MSQLNTIKKLMHELIALKRGPVWKEVKMKKPDNHESYPKHYER
jgi:hypothetical protein